MNHINVVGFESTYGYKTLELYQGDLSRIDPRVDVMVISAVRGSYIPTPGSMVAALYENWHIRVEDIRREARLDLVNALGFWISEPLQMGPADRILCLELSGRYTDVHEAMENLFVALSVVEAKGLSRRHIALPLLGSGSQAIDAEAVVPELLEVARRFLRRSDGVERLMLVERDPSRAKLLAEGINSVLGRTSTSLPKGKLIQEVRQAILSHLDHGFVKCENGAKRLLADMRHVFGDPSARSYQVGVVVRRFAEVVVRDLAEGTQSGHLYNRIEKLREGGVAKWVITYLHILRVFGNEGAHETDERVTPAAVEESDLAVCLLCTHRVLEIWLGAEPA